MMDESNRSLDKLADEFEAIWARGTRPDIAEFLDRVESPQRTPLAALLVPIDAGFRQRSGEPIHVDDYAKFAGIDASLIEPWLRAVVPESAEIDPVIESPAWAGPGHSTDEQDQATQIRDIPALHSTQQRRRMIGPYKLLRRLGEGGMGEVWMAEQSHPVKRRVALKLIKAETGSREVIARFEAERQALALMNHPNIARILDIGATEQGQPYFVMELVTGTPLTLYCDDHQLSIDERLELFTQVCAGVQHAHQKGIIHRDLKPGNIIVGMVDGLPVPKVIDFGLAKATESIQRLTDKSVYTEVGQILGTLKYMSPEQASLNNLDIDTRTDIYSLGIILYELLTGSTPLDSSSIKDHAVIKVLEFIRDKEPVKPSSKLSTGTSEQVSTITGKRKTDPIRLNRLLQGDLDWIVMKALETERSRRYESASGFAADIGRYLSGDAVTARPPSWNYRVRKFVRKNRAGVIAAALLGLSLLAGLLGTSYGLYRANLSAAAEQIAKQDAQKREAEAVEQRNRAEAREQEAIDAVKRFGDSVRNNPELKNNPALESLRKTLLQEPLTFFQSLRTRLESDSDTRPDSLARLASVAWDLGKLTSEIGNKQDALRAYEHAREILERLAREHPTVTEFQSDLSGSHYSIGRLLSETGKPTEAMRAYERAVEIQQRLAHEHPTVTRYQSGLAFCLDDIGALLGKTGKPSKAMGAYEQALEIFELLSHEHPTVTEYQSGLANCHNSIGNLLIGTGKPTEALQAYEQALEIRERLTRKHPTVTEFQSDLANSHHNIGFLLRQTGKPTEALQAYEQALEIRERLARDHPTVTGYQNGLAFSLDNIGSLLSQTGKPSEAMLAYEQALEIFELLSHEHPMVTGYQRGLANCHNSIGNLLSDTGKPTEAMRAYEQALEIFELLSHEHPMVTGYQSDLANCHNSIGFLLRQTGKPTEALQAYEQALEIRERLALDHPTVTGYQSGLALSLNNIGSLLSQTGKPSEAMLAYEQALEIFELLSREHPMVTGYQSGLANCHNSIGNLLGQTGKPTEALRAHEQALEIRERLAREHSTVTQYHSDVGATLNNLAMVQLNDKRFAEAGDHLLQAIEHQQRALASNPSHARYRQLLRSHLSGLTQAAAGLDDVDLARKAREGLAELTISDPAYVELNERLTAVLDDAANAKPDELLKLGQFGYDTRRFVPATQMYAQALANQPELADERQSSQIAYNAACCAALAASESGLDNPPPDEAAKQNLRAQALAWLQAELDHWEKFAKAEPAQSPMVERTLRHWQQDTDLKSIRDPDQLKNLPESELAAWEELWQRVREMAAEPAGDS